MRRAFRNVGVPCPDFIQLSDCDDPYVEVGRMVLPVVLKPVDSMGARAVQRVDSLSGLEEAFEKALKCSRVSRVIVESYMEGPELSLDAIVYNSIVSVCGIADRHIFFPPYFVEMGHTMPSTLNDNTLDEAVEVFKKGIAAIGIDNGAAKGDIKITSEGAKVGEIAARLSGGYMSGWTFPYSSGIEVTEAALNIAVGLPPGNLVPVARNYSAERAFLSIPGKIQKIYGQERASSIESIEFVNLRVKSGDTVVFPTNNLEKCGNVISKSSNRENAITASENAARCFFIRLEPDNSDTDTFLFSDAKDGNRIAFTLSMENNMKILGSMADSVPSAGRLAVLSLPDLEAEQSRDWHGMKVHEAFDKVISITGVSVAGEDEATDASDPGEFILGGLFWCAFLTGGVQGGVYIIDTIQALREKKRGSC